MSEIYTAALEIPVIGRTDAVHIPMLPDGTLEPVVTLPNPDGARSQLYAYDQLAGRAPELAVVADVLAGGTDLAQDEATIDAANEAIEHNPGILVAFSALRRTVESKRSARAARLVELMRAPDGTPVALVADTNGQVRTLPTATKKTLYVPAQTDVRGAAQRSLGGHHLVRAS